MTVVDGQSAIKVLDSQDYKFDVMFLDLMPSGIIGLEVLKHVSTANTRYVDLLIIMQTAKASDVDRRNGLKVGADYYLSKPFDESAFLLALHVTLPTISFT